MARPAPRQAQAPYISPSSIANAPTKLSTFSRFGYTTLQQETKPRNYAKKPRQGSTMTKAFDNQTYITEQASFIRERMRNFDGRLYLEFGGKLVNDFHAARVLPGYDPNVKVRLLQELQRDAEIILCIQARAIEHRKMRADYGITYDADAMKLIDDLRAWGLTVSAVVITRWKNQPQAQAFRTKLENRGIRVYAHAPIKGYP